MANGVTNKGKIHYLKNHPGGWFGVGAGNKWTGSDAEKVKVFKTEAANIPWSDEDYQWVSNNLPIAESYSTLSAPTPGQGQQYAYGAVVIYTKDLVDGGVRQLNGKSGDYSQAEKNFIKKYEDYIRTKHLSFYNSYIDGGKDIDKDLEGILAAALGGTKETLYHSFKEMVKEKANEYISTNPTIDIYAQIRSFHDSTGGGGIALQIAGAINADLADYAEETTETDKKNHALIKDYKYNAAKLNQNLAPPPSSVPPIENIDNLQESWNQQWGIQYEAAQGWHATIVEIFQGVKTGKASARLDLKGGLKTGNLPVIDNTDYKEEIQNKFNELKNVSATDDETVRGSANRLVKEVGDKIGRLQVIYFQIFEVSRMYLQFLHAFKQNEKLKKDGTKYSAEEIFDRLAAHGKKQIENALKEAQEEINKNKQQTAAATLSKESVEAKQRANLQCALLMNLKMFADDFEEKLFVGKRPNRRQLIRAWLGDDKKDPDELINYLMTQEGKEIDPFLNITPEIASALVPMVRLFKVETLGKKLKQTEFVFDSYTNQNPDRNFTLNDIDRGDGAGIKEFSFSFHGGNPTMSRKDIKAKLVMTFQTFKDFISVRNRGQKGNKYRFVDLMLFQETDGKKKIGFGKHSINQYDPSYYRIRADVGWAIRDDKEFSNLLRNRNTEKTGQKSLLKTFKGSLEKINQSFFLNMVEHNINIKKDGTIEVTAEYQAYIESVAKTAILDGLSTPKLLAKRKELHNEVEGVLYTKCTKKSNGKINSQKENLMRLAGMLEDKYIQEAYQSVMKRLIERGLIFRKYIRQGDLDPGAPGKFSKVPEFISVAKANKEIELFNTKGAKAKAKKRKSAKKQAEKAGAAPSMTDFKLLPPGIPLIQVSYFYMNDLIDVLLDSRLNLQEGDKTPEPRPELQKVKVILGSFMYEGKSINIGQIPISTQYFFEWFTDEVISKNLKKLPLMNFIRSLTTHLIKDMLGEACVVEKSDTSVEFRTTVASHIKDIQPHKTPPYKLNISSGDYRLQSYMKPGKNINDDLWQYIIVYTMKPGKSKEKTGRGDPVADSKKGIHHLHIGANRGIVKSISFEKTDIPYAREARYYRHGFDGLGQIGAVYNAKIDMIGNTIFYPGMLVFVNPMGIGGRDFDPTKLNTAANALGFGGYHLITKVDSVLTPGSFKTTVTAMHNYTGEQTSKKPKEGTSKKQNKQKESVECNKLIKKYEDILIEMKMKKKGG